MKHPHNHIPIATLAELAEERASVKFHFLRNGKKVEGVVIRFCGKFYAFENLCRHLPLTLDYDDNRFFTPDGKHLICKTHGAIYEPDTGHCVRGPCTGESLIELKILIEKGQVYLKSE